jgi:uncharacterized phage protein gp47/JayE
MSISSTGFTRARLADIKADYDQRFTDALGAVNTSPDAVVGQLIGIFAAALDDVNETLQDTYDAMYPASAEGVSLDGSVSFVGLQRLGATATTVTACVYGTESTLLPAGVLTRSGTKQYATTSDVVITRASALDVEIEVTTVLNSTSYQIIAGGVSAQFTSDSSATGAEIAAGLAAAFNPANFTAVATGSKIRLTAADKVSGFPLTLDTTLTIKKLGSPAVFTCVELGASAVPVASLNVIDTPTLGWDSVSNLAIGSVGRNVETDSELRTRHAISVRATGSATVKAMRARLIAEVPEITTAQIYENRTALTVDSMPPHSVEAVVVGGTDQQVINKLWEVKPAGIETYGTTSGTVVDENGDSQTIKFSRPSTKYAWVRVSVNLLYPEESLSATAQAAISAAVLSYGSGLTVGDDIITQRFYGPIYGSTSGLGQITVEAAVTATAGGVPTYSTNNVAIARSEVATFDASRIVVVGV